MDLNYQANEFIFNSKVGDFYLKSGEKNIVTKRTKNRIYFSDGTIIHIKKLSNGILYLDSKSVIRNNRSYPVVNQVLRDIEGYLLYKIHSKSLI